MTREKYRMSVRKKNVNRIIQRRKKCHMEKTNVRLKHYSGIRFSGAVGIMKKKPGSDSSYTEKF